MGGSSDGKNLQYTKYECLIPLVWCGAWLQHRVLLHFQRATHAAAVQSFHIFSIFPIFALCHCCCTIDPESLLKDDKGQVLYKHCSVIVSTTNIRDGHR